MFKSCGVVGGFTLDYTVSSGPFLSYEIEIGDGPGPDLDNLYVWWKNNSNINHTPQNNMYYE